MAELPATTPYRESSPGTLTVPLRSDPPWLRLGLFGVSAACVGVFMLYFLTLAAPRPSLLLAFLPGLAVATFAGSALAWWGRRHGGTLSLEAADVRLSLREPRRREELVDRGSPFGGVLLTDTASAFRVLILSQHGEPVVILDTSHPADAPRHPTPAGRWAARTIPIDLSAIALSPSSSHVLTVTVDHTIEPLLGSLDRDLTDEAPLLSFPLPSGEVLALYRESIRVGRRTAALGPGALAARKITVATPTGQLAAISLTDGEISLLLACQDPNDLYEGTPSDTPDAYLPPLVFAAVAAIVGAVDAAPRDAAAENRA